MLRARELSGLERITDLVKEGLEALIAREARKRLAAFGGTDPEADILALVESARLNARGIGWADAGLLAACKAYPCRLWTKDARLTEAAAEAW